jgi:hypothetical protein
MVNGVFTPGPPWDSSSSPSKEAYAMGTYLGSADLVDRPLNPLEARIFAKVAKHAEIEEPEIEIKHLGHVTSEDVGTDFPYRSKVNRETTGDWTHYAISAEIRSDTGRFVTTNWESLRDDLRNLLMDYHVAAMYDQYDHDAFTASADGITEAEADMRESEMDFEDRPDGVEYNYRAFHRDVVPVLDQDEAATDPGETSGEGGTTDVTVPLSLEAVRLHSLFQQD